MTNFEDLTPEFVAGLFSDMPCTYCDYCPVKESYGMCKNNCYEYALKWLKDEAKEKEES